MLENVRQKATSLSARIAEELGERMLAPVGGLRRVDEVLRVALMCTRRGLQQAAMQFIRAVLGELPQNRLQ